MTLAGAVAPVFCLLINLPKYFPKWKQPTNAVNTRLCRLLKNKLPKVNPKQIPTREEIKKYIGVGDVYL